MAFGSCGSTCAAIVQLGERQTEDLKVPGSIPGLGMSPTPCAALGAVVSQCRERWQKTSAIFADFIANGVRAHKGHIAF